MIVTTCSSSRNLQLQQHLPRPLRRTRHPHLKPLHKLTLLLCLARPPQPLLAFRYSVASVALQLTLVGFLAVLLRLLQPLLHCSGQRLSQLPQHPCLARPPRPLEEAYLVASVGLEEAVLLLLPLLLDCSAVLLRLLQPLVHRLGQRLPQLPLHCCLASLQLLLLPVESAVDLFQQPVLPRHLPLLLYLVLLFLLRPATHLGILGGS